MKLRILIVEDSEKLLAELAMSISMIDGIEIVGTAQSEKEAIDMYGAKKPDVVILDIQLKEGNGLNVLAAVKKETPPPIVLMLTNYPFSQYREKCKELGADFFFDKSRDIQGFMHKLWEISHLNQNKMEENK